MGQCPRCGKKQLVSSGLCSSCMEATALEQDRRNAEAIKVAIPNLFNHMIWETVNARFGMSKPGEKDWAMIDQLIKAERDQFMSIASGINTGQFVCGMQYNPSTKKTESLFTGWERTVNECEGPGMTSFYDNRARDMNLCVRRAVQRIHIYCNAEIAIRAGRFEDAARSYENLTMYEEAGRIRKMAMQERNTSRNVSVNMNQLIDQVRQGGLAFAYKCPNCGGSIKIDENFNPGMKVCGFCGTPLDTTLIATMIRNM